MSTVDQELRRLEREWIKTKAHEDLFLWVEALVRYGAAEEKLASVREELEAVLREGRSLVAVKKWGYPVPGVQEKIEEANAKIGELWFLEGLLMQALGAASSGRSRTGSS